MVFIKAFAGTAVVAFDLKCFSDSKVVCQFLFLFALHVNNRFEIFTFELFLAVLIMLGNTRVLPLLLSNGSAVLFPSLLVRSCSLAYIDGFIITWTFVSIHTFPFLNVWFRFIFRAKDIF